LDNKYLGAGRRDEATRRALDRTKKEASDILEKAIAEMEARGIARGTISFVLADHAELYEKAICRDELSEDNT
jgi:hypothetical protein